MQKIALLLLAAGASTRMKDHIKQLLPFKNTTFLEHAVKNAKESNASEVFVVLGANYDTILATTNLEGVAVIKNDEWHLGLGSSIAKGVIYINSLSQDYEAVLIGLADQPLMDADFYNHLMTSFEHTDYDLVATAYGTKKGVPAVIAKKYFEILMTFDQDYGAQKILNDKKTLGIEGSTKSVDIDTWEDYQALRNKKD
ncbi:NTP transferase domain-containing protein [Cellulophaga sp. L1A9]|uniref:nucleotidyltransferase family protein n=1 Tax=Cellulophaga sp. L1A9 TaxID=2686362 RepID=UPI00131C5A45|nr:nucleotidyltransferase family protein [Cellulophaga sp. L1A9]